MQTKYLLCLLGWAYPPILIALAAISKINGGIAIVMGFHLSGTKIRSLLI
jgi:hypothetical protein